VQVVCVLQCVAMCCSLLQCSAVSCSVSQFVAECCSAAQCVALCGKTIILLQTKLMRCVFFFMLLFTRQCRRVYVCNIFIRVLARVCVCIFCVIL